LLVKNTVINALAFVIPGLIFIPAAAFLSRTLGVEQFGLLLLMYSIMGYSGIFDAGMTRAVIRKIAQSKSIINEQCVMGTSIVAVLLLSIIPTALLFIFAKNIVQWLSVSEEHVNVGIQSIQLLSLIVPFYLFSAVAFAYLEGKEQFLKLSIFRATTGSVLAGAPALMVYYDGTLTDAVIGMFAARILTTIVAFVSLNQALRIKDLKFSRKMLIDLVSFGGWISLSNIISPLMAYMDRFFLSNVSGVGKAAFYIAPSELIEKLTVIPVSLSRVLFPFFSRIGSHKHHEEKVLIGLGFFLIIILLPIYYFSGHILDLWLGPPYGAESSSVLRILLCGFFFNALALIPFSAIQAKGLAKTTALLHLAEFVPYSLLLFYLIHEMGLIGAAFAWSIRVTIDFACLLYISKNISKNEIINEKK
jgi:O-antigen/teichoic acid export membrane protein